MSTEVLTQLVIATPSAAAVVVTVVIFLRFLRDSNLLVEARLTAISEQCHQVQKQGHEVQREGHVVQREGHVVMRENTAALDAFSDALRHSEWAKKEGD